MKGPAPVRIGLALVLVACAAFLAVGVLGTRAMRTPDADPQRIAVGSLLSPLREGGTLDLREAYPQPWDEVQIVAGAGFLTKGERVSLFSHYPSLTFVDEEASLLLFWAEGQLVSLVQYPPRIQGYPYFVDAAAPEEGRLYYSRENAVFDCTFVSMPSGKGGYYECTPATLQGVGAVGV